MRTKSRFGGRRKLSSASIPPSTASPSVSVRSQSQPQLFMNTKKEHLRSKFFLSCQNDESVSGQEAPNAEENTLNETSGKDTRDVLVEVDCFRKDICIICDRREHLLACNGIGCPIALHESCMSCQPTFDEEWHFYCPYCSYKRALIRVHELRRKAMVAKRALSDFIDSRMVSGDKSLLTEEADKEKATGVSAHGAQVEQNQNKEGEDQEKTGGDVQATVGINGEIHDNPLESNVSNNSHCQKELTPEVQPLENSINEEETREAEADPSGTHQVESLGDKDGKMMEEENLGSRDPIQNEETVKDQGQPETSSAHHGVEEPALDDADLGTQRAPQDKGDGGEQIHPGKDGVQTNINVGSGNNDLKNEIVVKKRRFKTLVRRADTENSDFPRKSSHTQAPKPREKSPSPERSRDHGIEIEEVSVSRIRLSPTQFKNLNFLGGKRKRLQWSAEEEEILKEGVHKFSSTVNKNLPWRKILEFGRHIFDGTRTPADLKDKWRNILAKNPRLDN